jgi:CRISPR/Cas system endoribonuclease Cas6 (RAMP superfamily)
MLNQSVAHQQFHATEKRNSFKPKLTLQKVLIKISQGEKKMEDKALLAEQLQKKWQPVLEHPDLPTITDSYKRNVTTILLENEEQVLMVTSAPLTPY